jgi:hypothetical protein
MQSVQQAAVSLLGVTELELRVHAAGSNANAHAVWVDPMMKVCGCALLPPSHLFLYEMRP